MRQSFKLARQCSDPVQGGLRQFAVTIALEGEVDETLTEQGVIERQRFDDEIGGFRYT